MVDEQALVPGTDWLVQSVFQKLQDSDAKWLRIYWCDYTASSKCRLIPIEQAYKVLDKNRALDTKTLTLSITTAALGLLPNDVMIPGVTPSGAYSLCPDWSTLRAGPIGGHVSCYGEFQELDGSTCSLCPRTLLRKVLEKAATHGIEFLIGFEIEFIAMERSPDNQDSKYQTIHNDGHSWSASRVLADWGREGSFSTAFDEIFDRLKAAGIIIELLHAEAAPGQYEIVLPPMSPLEACDVLLHSRQIIESVAARHGYRTTIHPKPWAEACGSASHAHISISSPGGDLPQVYESFYAGTKKPPLSILMTVSPVVAKRDSIMQVS